MSVGFLNFRAVSANANANAGDFLNVTTAASTIVVTLPPVEFGGPVFVKKVDSGAGAIKVVTADGSTIDGVAGATGRTQAATQYAVWRLESDRAGAWYILN